VNINDKVRGEVRDLNSKSFLANCLTTGWLGYESFHCYWLGSQTIILGNDIEGNVLNKGAH